MIQLSSELIEYESYSAEVAQDDYDYRATAEGPGLKIANDYAFVKYVENKIINEKYSLDAVIMGLEQTGSINETERPFKTKICTKTLYNYIENDLFPNLTNKDLPRESKEPKRKQKRVRRAHRMVRAYGNVLGRQISV